LLCLAIGLSSVGCLAAADEPQWQAAGQPRLILSAEFDYARLPRELWRQRILLARSARFNALTIPVFWSFHEPQPGRFLFDGRRDLGALLDLCRRENMGAIVRIGPWLDGDWELGGLPPWLLIRMVHSRTYDREFLAAAGLWLEKLVPLLAARQIQQGGAVILVEIEANPEGEPNRANPAYSDYLRERLRSLGIVVPVVPAQHGDGDKPFAYALSDGPLTGSAQRAVLRLGKARPWGEEDVVLDRSMEVVGLLARGARWLDCRGFFGGTNFGFQAAEGLPARHDCGAPVGEAGDLRPTYFALKQWLCWARGVEPLLVGSRPEATSNSAIAAQRFPGWRYSSPAGQLLFVERRPGTAWWAGVRLGDSSPTIERIEFEPRGLWPTARNWVLSDIHGSMGILPMIVHGQDARATTTVEASAVKLLHLGMVGGRRLLVAGVTPGEQRTIRFRTAAGRDSNVLHIAGSADGEPRSFRVMAGGSVQVVAVSEPLFARTWPLATARENAALIGSDALLDVATSPGGATHLVVGSASLPAAYRIYADAARVTTSRGTATFAEQEGCWIIHTGSAESAPPPPLFNLWQQRDDNPDAQALDNDSSWTIGSEPYTAERLPTPIASPYIWYRTTFDAPAFSTYTLRVGGIGDRATVFVNGWRLGSFDGALTDEMTFILPGGPHVLSLLVEHNGRDDLRRDNWPIPDHCFKGLRPPAVILAEGLRAPIPFWQFVINNRGPDEVRKVVFSDSGEENWGIIWPGPDDMNQQSGFAWYRFGGDPHQSYIFYPAPRQGMLEIRMPGVDDRAWVYLDGQLVGTHDDPRRGRLIRVPDTLRIRQEKTSHSLAVLVENRSGPGGMTGPVRVAVTQSDAAIHNSPWQMRVGLTGELEGWFLPSRLAAAGAAWGDITTPTRRTVVRWYRTRFSYSPLVGAQHAVPFTPSPTNDRAETFFLHLGWLRRGVVWLNGHCLGRYRQSGYDAERGICLPSCRLERENWIVVAETGAGLPQGAFLSRDPASHYYLTTLRIEP
jgi:beta-galactosidase